MQGLPDATMVAALQALSNPVRLGLLHRLERPAFLPDLAHELGMTRQAVRKHLDALETVGLVASQRARRRGLPATRFVADPVGLFRFKEEVMSLAVSTDPATLPPLSTTLGTPSGGAAAPAGPGLLLVHGDAPGRWFALQRRGPHVIGRDAKADIALAYDAFASARNAVVQPGDHGWTVTDLHSTNGTRVNFQPLPIGGTGTLAHGDLLTVGRSHLLFRAPGVG